MKKILSLVTIAMLTVTVIRAQNGWITHKGDDRVSVKFPSEPKETVPGTFVSIASKDSSIVYVFSIVDFTKFGIDSAALVPLKTIPQFAAQLKAGIKKSIPAADFEDIKISTWKGFTSYTTSGTDSKAKKYDMFMFIIGSKLYSLSTVRLSGVDVKGRDDYFAAVEITH
jgi:hypothetical protein